MIIDHLGVKICANIQADDFFRGGPKVVTFVNPGCFKLLNDYSYARALEKHDYILADGIGVVLGAKMLGDKITRYSFDDTSLAPKVFSLAEKRGYQVAVVGGYPGVVERFEEKIKNDFPGLNIFALMHGYSEDYCIVSAIKNAQPDVVILGMGAPRQEILGVKIREAGCRSVIFTCGGFLDQKVASDNYYPVWIDKFNIRFVYRIYKEPRRLFRRYFIDYQHYLILLLKNLWGKDA